MSAHETDPQPAYEPVTTATGMASTDTYFPFPSATRLHFQESAAKLRHSLRTPLNQIIGYSEMLIESAGLINAQLLHDLKSIHNAGGQLLAYINDALAAWKIDTGQIDIASLDRNLRPPLDSIIDSAKRHHQGAVNAGQHELAQDLQRILGAARNLDNTFKHEALPFAQQLGAAELDPQGLGQSSAPRLVDSSHTTPPGFIAHGSGNSLAGRILAVDDDPVNRNMLIRRLRKLGFEVEEAVDGHDALQKLKNLSFDLVLLDVMMPGLDGFQTLEFMKSDPRLRHVPVIMLTALDDPASTVRCIETGAEDYVPKPFNAVILRARITASLEKKRLRDKEQAFIAEIQSERAKSDRLLLNVLPKPIADRLKAGEHTIVDSFIEATVLFADIVGFTLISSRQSPQRTAQLLNQVFSNFDRIADQYGLEKIKTIGDAYMLVGGIPVIRDDHASACASAAFDMLEALRTFNRCNEQEWTIRIGINSGPVVAGIIGTRKFSYDLWGDTVNIASRMESYGQPGRVHVSEATKNLLAGQYDFEPVEQIEMKYVGPRQTYFLKRKSS